MKPLHGALLVFVICAALVSGCMEPPIKEPTVSVGEIALADISLQKMTINTTVLIHNPNPFGGRLSHVSFDIWYPDEGMVYLGHGEQTNIDVRENGTTSVTIPVTVGTMDAVGALSSLARKGSITLDVNGSASVDLRVMTYTKPFRQSRTYTTADMESALPVSLPVAGSINVTDKLAKVQGFLAGITG